MNDEFETRVAAWLRERARPDPASLAAVRGTIDALPARHRDRRRGWLLATAAALAVVAVGLSSLVLAPPPDGSAPTGPSRPVPPDPAAFAGDPRLELCSSGPQGLLAVFEMAHMADYQRHLPNAYPLIGLTVDPSTLALVAVYAGPPSDGRQPLPAISSPGPNDHDLCIVAGKDSESWVQIGAADVDISGMRVDIGTSEATPSPPASPPTPTPRESSSPTSEPAPSWASDLLGQLECRGDPQLIGGDPGAISPVGRSGTASPYPWLYAVDDDDMPLEGWVESPKVDWESGNSSFVRYVNEVDGRVVAIIVMQADTGGWAIAAYRACPPSEFDPLRGRTTDDGPWLDANGVASETVRTIVGPAHCGWESTVWMFIGDRLFLRDPTGIFADIEVGAYVPDAKLPSDAQDSGLSSYGRRLFTVPDGNAVFVETSNGVERWPRSTDSFIGCA